MKVREGRIPGVLRILPQPVHDERGFFARTFNAELAERCGSPDHEALAWNPAAWTLRGLHYQRSPWAEAKRVRCLRGAIWDVVVDLRPSSATFLEWEAFELNEENLEGLYLPAGCAHGYLTLRPDSLVEYAIYAPYRPEAATGVRWDDPQLGIAWPREPAVISERDRGLPGVDGAQ